VRRLAVALVVLAGVVAAGCAKRISVTIPEGEDYVAPAVPAEVPAGDRKALQEAWQDVLTGDTAAAVRQYEKLLARRPDLAPARAGLAYARLRAGRLDEAAAAFEAILADRPDDVAALVGAGGTAFRRGDVDAAVGFYRRAQGSAPDDALVRRRLTALKLQAADARMALARDALAGGDAATAMREYEAALEAAPEVAGVRLALAEVMVKAGDVPGAVAVLEADPTQDRQVGLRRASLLMGQQEYARAGEVYRELLARDPGDEAARAGEKAAREGQEFVSMPEEYRRIGDSPRVTRADLAALVAVRVHALERLGAGEPRVAVDISMSWAREHVARVLALGIMDVYPNHTFQPGAAVRRVDLARAAARVLDRLGWPRSAGPLPSDMSRSHLDYDAVERVLGAALMTLAPSGAFEPWRPVSGSEAIEVVDGVARLTGS
jgi:thioredoxin-like negative regulator of GroEL